MSQDPGTDHSDKNEIEYRQLFSRLWRGRSQIVAFGLLGAAIVMIAVSIDRKLIPTETSLRVAFAFQGLERGQYPDGSFFEPDDLRSADLVSLALKNVNLPVTDGMQSVLRGAISVVGVIPPNIAKERDRLRAAGQTPPVFIPDEFVVSLNLPSSISLSERQRQLFLNELISLYQTRFQRLYAEIPLEYGVAFASLHGCDYFEYELILSRELRNIRDFLSGRFTTARNFRSPSTGLSFDDLLTQIDLFSELRVNGVMGMVYSAGLTKDRELALRKLDYQLSILNDNEKRLTKQEQVILDLLSKSQQRAQDYVFGAKSQTASDRPLVDQGLIDSLIASDSSNFLIRRALEAGLKVQEVHSDIEQVSERRKRIESFVHNGSEHTGEEKVFTTAFADLEVEYNRLLDSVKKTNQDYVRQEYADAVRITMQAESVHWLRSMLLGAAAGFSVGLIVASALSLLEIYLPRVRVPSAAKVP
jgi:hypothetical protein